MRIIIIKQLIHAALIFPTTDSERNADSDYCTFEYHELNLILSQMTVQTGLQLNNAIDASNINC